MKHDRFIELLNLYLDGEISREESADLEREITQNPERRRIYRQYCQMQRACSMLSEKFRDVAETQAPETGEKVVAFPGQAQPSWWRNASLVAAGAVAACAVFVVARSGLTSPTGTLAANPARPAVTRVENHELVIPAMSLAAQDERAFELRRQSDRAPWMGDANVVTGAIPASNRTPRSGSLFSAVPPLPDYRQPIGIQVDFQSAARPELKLTPVGLQTETEFTAFQFPR